MERTLKELYREQYESYSVLSQEEIEELYALEGIEEDSIDKYLIELKKEIQRKKDELPSAEDRLLKSIFGTDNQTEKALNEINKLEQKLVDLENTYNSLSFNLQDGFNLDMEEMLKVIKQEIIDKKRELEKNNAQNLQNEENEIKAEIAELEKRYEKLRFQYNNFYNKFHKAVRGIMPKTRKFPSRELRNKIVEGTLGIARYWASIYYRKPENTNSFDDLHQIANQALISAAHYYIPSDRAKFTTYARRCIENNLKKAVYNTKKMKKRPYKPQDFFQRERLLIRYIKMFLKSSGLEYTKLLSLRNNIRDFNRTARKLGETKNVLPSFSYNFKSSSEKRESIINYIINGLKNSKINVLITEEERELINLYLTYTKKPNDKMYIYELYNYLNLFLNKLDLIEEYLSIEEKLQNDNEGITPKEEEILEEFNRRVKLINSEKYRLKKEGFYKQEPQPLKKLASYYGMYMDEYNVDPFISAEDYEDGYCISKQKEKDDILDEREIDDTIWECNEAIEINNLKKNDKIILYYKDENFNQLIDYSLCIEKLNEDKVYKLLTIGEATIELERLENLESDEEYLERVLKERRDYVNFLLRDANSEIILENRRLQEIRDKYFDGSQYKKYYKPYQMLQAKNSIELLYSADLELMTLLKKDRDSSKTTDFTVEEEAFNNIFLEDYYKELEHLSELEREVLIRYFDTDGLHSMTAKEIGEELEISPAKVYKLKASGLRKLSNSKIIQSYCEE